MKPNEENSQRGGRQGPFVTFCLCAWLRRLLSIIFHRRWLIQRFKLGLGFFSLIDHRLVQLIFYLRRQLLHVHLRLPGRT